MFIRLKNPDGMFHDPETGLSVVKSEIVEIHKTGPLTQAWLNGGGLVCCDSEMIKKQPQDKRGTPSLAAVSEDASKKEVEPKDVSEDVSRATSVDDASDNKSKTKVKKKS